MKNLISSTFLLNYFCRKNHYGIALRYGHRSDIDFLSWHLQPRQVFFCKRPALNTNDGCPSTKTPPSVAVAYVLDYAPASVIFRGHACVWEDPSQEDLSQWHSAYSFARAIIDLERFKNASATSAKRIRNIICVNPCEPIRYFPVSFLLGDAESGILWVEPLCETIISVAVCSLGLGFSVAANDAKNNSRGVKSRIESLTNDYCLRRSCAIALSLHRSP